MQNALDLRPDAGDQLEIVDCGRLLDAGRPVRIVERRLRRCAGLLAGGADRLAAQQFRRRERRPVPTWPTATCAASPPFRPQARPCWRPRRRRRAGWRWPPSRLRRWSCRATASSACRWFRPHRSSAWRPSKAAPSRTSASAARGRSASPQPRFLVARRLQQRRSRRSATSGPIAAPTRCGRSAVRPARRRPCRSRTGR